jgi:hypothetical protein
LQREQQLRSKASLSLSSKSEPIISSREMARQMYQCYLRGAILKEVDFNWPPTCPCGLGSIFREEDGK